MSSGESDLGRILAGLDPVVRPGAFVYLTLADPPPVRVEALVVEDEAVTVVVTQEVADAHGWSYAFVAGWITLRVHSALEAVGLTAAFATALAERQIPCNVLAGAFHDHLLVPIGRVDDALAALATLTAAPASTPASMPTSTDAVASGSALAVNVPVPEDLQWTDRRRGVDYRLTSITVRLLPDGFLAAKAYGRPAAGGRGGYTAFPVPDDPRLRALVDANARDAGRRWAGHRGLGPGAQDPVTGSPRPSSPRTEPAGPLQ